MRVLHIWNTAGVASTIAKYQRKVLGWDSYVITRKKFDPFGYTETAGVGVALNSNKYAFVLRSILMAHKYDLVHVHSLDKILPILNIIKRNNILHYHGSDIRGQWNVTFKKFLYNRANIVLVSTPDLYNEVPQTLKGKKVFYLPNPVDTEIFKPLNIRRLDKGLVIVKKGRKHMWPLIKKHADKLSREYDVEYDVLFADETPVPYQEMPVLLNKYKYFFDIPHGFTSLEEVIPALSKTALEALACGAIVLSPFFGEIWGLPREHHPKNVVKLLAEIISEHI